jgi:cysteine desulfurase family protein
VADVKRSIYLDNAATSFPKPEAVYQAQDAYTRTAGNPGRGAYARSVDSAKRIFDVRMRLASFLGIRSPERLIFTAGCTHSINTALKGLGFQKGDVILTGPLEHNALMRPLRQIQNSAQVRVLSLPYAKSGVIVLNELNRALADTKPRLAVISEASNVTGEIVDLAAVAKICASHHVRLMVDAAQTAGFTESKVDELGIGLWCASGHKSLMGTPGVGLLYVAPYIKVDPLIAGGTGSRSDGFDMPDHYPDHLEAGTLPGPAIAALGEAIDWLDNIGLEKIRRHETALTKHFIERISKIKGVRIFGDLNAPRTPTVSFSIDGIGADIIAGSLDDLYQIAVRSGLHCAALAHRNLGTTDTGLVRVSFGYFNTASDVDAVCEAIVGILRSPANRTQTRA